MKRLSSYLFLALTVALVALLGCDADILGFSDGDSQEIGPEGGQISGYGVTLIFEPGDLPWPVDVQIERWNNPKPLPDGFAQVGTPVKISPFGQMVNGSYDILWDVSELPSDNAYYIFVWDTKNGRYRVVGVGSGIEAAGINYYLHNLVLAKPIEEHSTIIDYNDNNMISIINTEDRLDKSTGYDDMVGDRYLHRQLYYNESTGEKIYDITNIDVLVGLYNIQDMPLNYNGVLHHHNDYYGFTYTYRSAWESDWVYDGSEAKHVIGNAAQLPEYGMGLGYNPIYRFDIQYNDTTVLNHTEFAAVNKYGTYHSPDPYIIWLPDDYQYGDPDDDGEGYPLPKPDLIKPDDNSITTSKPFFEWSEVRHADYYSLLIANLDGEYDPLLIYTDNCYYQIDEDEELIDKVSYRWMVEALSDDDGLASSGWSESRTITVEAENHDPDPPVCVYPQDGSDNISIDTYLDWDCEDPDGDPLTYTVFLRPDDGGWEQIDDEYIDHDNSRCNLPYSLEYNTLYHWTVQAFDPSGEMSEPLEGYWSFQTESEQGTPPDTPELIYPGYQDEDIPLQPTFRWTAVMRTQQRSHGLSPTSASYGRLSPADYYEIIVDDDADFSDPEIYENSLTTTYYTPDSGVLDYSTRYYWSVQAHNDYGSSGWADTWWFDTQGPGNQPPLEPSNPNPADEGSDVGIDQDLYWDCSDPDGDSLDYDIYWREVGDSWRLGTASDPDRTWDPGTMDYDAHYEWYVVADDGQETTEGPVWTYETGNEPNNPPNTPSSPDPGNGETGVDINADLSWYCDDPDGDSLDYDIYWREVGDSWQLGTASDPDRTWDPGTMDYDTDYEWYVVADDGQETTTGPIWSYSTGLVPFDPGEQPGCISPYHSTRIADTTPTFRWSSIPGATRYQIVLYPEGNPANPPIFDLVVTSTSYTYTTPLPDNASYGWKVRGGSDTQWGSWSIPHYYGEVDFFVIAPDALGIPSLIAPPDGSTTSDQTPTFDWSNVSGATSYVITVDDHPNFNPYETHNIDYTAYSSEYTPFSGLSPGTYYWRVRAIGGSNGTFSEDWSFTIQ
jgi:hypothetical protein